jgi:hypothetical protein
MVWRRSDDFRIGSEVRMSGDEDEFTRRRKSDAKAREAREQQERREREKEAIAATMPPGSPATTVDTANGPWAVQHPSVARVVHYVAYGTPGGEFPAGVCRAAIVTEVAVAAAPQAERLEDLEAQIIAERANGVPVLHLCVLNPTGLFFNLRVRYDANKAPGTWHWPERT